MRVSAFVQKLSSETLEEGFDSGSRMSRLVMTYIGGRYQTHYLCQLSFSRERAEAVRLLVSSCDNGFP